jgi:beta-1,4-mannosyl-glycoprotein beta-1,4-N-acetylglucosaminyltransferase
MQKKFLLALALLFSCALSQAKIYDCFMFFNEIEILKMRLEELDPVVDYFVLVESAETQRGDPKPFLFDENKKLYEKYLGKIIHIMVDETHPEMGLWERENYQRECIARGLHHCADSDLILISDLDEIPRKEFIKGLEQTIPPRNERLIAQAKYKKFKKHNPEKKGPSHEEKVYYVLGGRAFDMEMYFFQLNRQTPTGETWEGGRWAGTVATTYELVKKFGVQHFREYRWKFPKILDGGWHFTYMGGREKIRKKLGSIVEGRQDWQTITDEYLDNWINSHPSVPIDSSFPDYVQRNYDYLKSIGFIADF